MQIMDIWTLFPKNAGDHKIQFWSLDMQFILRELMNKEDKIKYELNTWTFPLLVRMDVTSLA